MDALTDADRLNNAYAFLEEIRVTGKLTGKTSKRETSKAIAHGLAYNPHVDGRLRLTPRGREKLEAAA
jgi:hypothetical protein